MTKIINFLLQLIASVLSFLPDSPFRFADVGQFIDIMGYVNFFIPFGAFVNILTAWLASIASYYIYVVALRWIKAVE